MTSIPIRSTDELIDSTGSIKKLTTAGRKRLAELLPKEDFDASRWDIRALHDRANQSTKRGLSFVPHESHSVIPFQTIYAEVIKSWVILDLTSASQMSQKLYSSRYLWTAICSRLKEGESFAWEQLREEDLRQAEMLMLERLSKKSTYTGAVYLGNLARFLYKWRICRPLYWIPQTLCPDERDRYTLEGQESRRDLLPSDKALAGLADIYRIHAKEPDDRLLICAIAILVVTGFRVDELLKMPEDCEVEEVHNSKSRYGLRIYKEKARRREKKFWVKWLTPVQAELAREAIAEIREITAPFRERAKILEADPSRVPIPGFSKNDRMTPDDVAHAFGYTRSEIHSKARLGKYTCYFDELGNRYYLASEIEAYLMSIRVENLWTVNLKNGNYQMLSETLLIVAKNFFHPGRGTNPLLIHSIEQGRISEFLTDRPKEGTRSAFQRFNITEDDGSLCEIHSHQLRHWLNDLADRGGLPSDIQSRWMGREYSKDTVAYQHMSFDQRIQWLKDGIRTGQITGEIPNFYFNLPESERDEFLEGQIVAVHFTPMGVCLHDFSFTPCPYHLNCVRGCADFCRTKGNQEERNHLLQLQQQTKQAIEMAKAAVADEQGDLAEHWVQHNLEMLQGIEAALAVDDDPQIPEGEAVYPFTMNKSRYEPKNS